MRINCQNSIIDLYHALIERREQAMSESATLFIRNRITLPKLFNLNIFSPREVPYLKFWHVWDSILKMKAKFGNLLFTEEKLILLLLLFDFIFPLRLIVLSTGNDCHISSTHRLEIQHY